MQPAHPLEEPVGVAYYVTDCPGTGGELRDAPGDFRVRELEAVDAEPVDADAADYPYLVVRATLRDWDTNAFARALANRLGASRERVAWAGTKDRRAVTTQLFTLQGVDPGGLPSVDGADLAVVGRAGRALQFGDLAGNAFEIRVTGADAPGNAVGVAEDLGAFAAGGDGRDATDGGGRDTGEAQDGERGADGEDGGAATEDGDVTWRGEVGVPNWFGHQRFGSRRPVTHVVGRRILERDWEGAVMAYLGNPGEHEPEATREARAYVEETRDWRGASERFPGGLRYERALCNELVGTAGTAGDFRAALDVLPWNLRRLFVHAVQSVAFNRMLSRRLDAGLPFDRPVAGDVVCFTEQRGSLRVPDPDRVQRVTPDRVDTVRRHVARGRALVTHPLVGTETDLAGGEPGAVERGVLADADLAPGDFDLPEPYDSAGTRRAVLATTDLAVSLGDDSYTMSFELPAGSYATAVCREFLQCSPLSL